MMMEYVPPTAKLRMVHAICKNNCRLPSHSHCLVMLGSVWEIALAVLGVGVFQRLRTLEEVSPVPGLINVPGHGEGSLCSVDCLEHAQSSC